MEVRFAAEDLMRALDSRMDARVGSLGGRMADVWDTAAGKPPTARLGQERWATRRQLLRIHMESGRRSTGRQAGRRERFDREAEAEPKAVAVAVAERGRGRGRSAPAAWAAWGKTSRH